MRQLKEGEYGLLSFILGAAVGFSERRFEGLGTVRF